jgi:hypothetical protein
MGTGGEPAGPYSFRYARPTHALPNGVSPQVVMKGWPRKSVGHLRLQRRPPGLVVERGPQRLETPIENTDNQERSRHAVHHRRESSGPTALNRHSGPKQQTE